MPDAFSLPIEPNDRIDYQSLKTDVAVIRHINSEQNTKIDRIDANVSQIPALITDLKISVKGIDTRLREVEIRSETIDENKTAIVRLAERVKDMDKAIDTLVIKSGPWRIRCLEYTVYTLMIAGTGGLIYGLLWDAIKTKLGLG